MHRIIVCVVLILFLNLPQMEAQQLYAQKKDSTVQWSGIKVLPQNFYNQHLGFFCRKEDLIQKATKVNVYFRLGSKAYVDYLERKPNAVLIDKGY